MNRFLSSQDDSNNSGDLSLSARTVTVDTSAVTDELTERTETSETHTTTLLERIRTLEDVGYIIPTFNAYTVAAQRKIASTMPYPSYVQFTTFSDLQSTSTRVLNSSGNLVSNATVDDVWQIILTGGRDILISSSTGVDLAQSYGK